MGAETGYVFEDEGFSTEAEVFSEAEKPEVSLELQEDSTGNPDGEVLQAERTTRKNREHINAIFPGRCR